MIVHKERPCHPDNYKRGRSGGVKYLVVHYVGATGDAGENARYYGTTKGLKASAHYFVGHGASPEVWASVAEKDTAWHCGGKKYVHPDCRNDNAIGVEICCHKAANGTWYFDPETLDAAVELCQDIVRRHNIPPERVLRHYDVTGKVCPEPFVRDPGAWADFIRQLFGEDEMRKCVATLKLANVRRISVVFGNGRSMAQVKADVGCDYILNGGLYDSTGGPVCHLKVDGVTMAKDPWSYVGYGWDHGPDIKDIIIPVDNAEVQNAIACVWLLGRGIGPGDKLLYDKALGGRRGRSAIALTEDSLILYCSKDGYSEVATPEELQKELAGMGAVSALMLDSGGSSQCDFNGAIVISSRRVNNYICVWTSKEEETIVGKYKVKTNGGTLTIRAEGKSGATVRGSYTNGTVVEVLEVKDGWGRTDKGWCFMAWMEPVPEDKPSPAPPATPSNQDKPADWAKTAWDRAKAAGVLDGTRPTDPITRQEVAVILDRLGLLGN